MHLFRRRFTLQHYWHIDVNWRERKGMRDRQTDRPTTGWPTGRC